MSDRLYISTEGIHIITRKINQDKQCLILIDDKLYPIGCAEIRKGQIILIPDLSAQPLE